MIGPVHLPRARPDAACRARIRDDLIIAVLAWLTEYSAVLVNRYQVGHDGKTGYERTRGKKSRMLGFEFGELMMFRRTPIGPRLAKLESLWETGVYVGYKSLSGEYMCSTATGVYKSRNVKRKPVEERWSGENMNSEGRPMVCERQRRQV